MNASTISKVQFFNHAIVLTLKGKLRTAGKSYVLFADRLLENRYADIKRRTADHSAEFSALGGRANTDHKRPTSRDVRADGPEVV
jgi:hypothetical protein